MSVTSILGSLISPFLVSEAFWCVKLSNGKFQTERDIVRDGNWPTGRRPFDWALDLVASGDIRRVKELWLICPPNPGNPLGQTAKLPIVEPGTAFQFKVGFVDGNIAGTVQSRASQLIGRVTDKVNGDCECFVWDVGLRALGTWNSNIYHMGSWRADIAPPTQLAFDVLGLSL